MTASIAENIKPVPAPWTLKGTIYAFMIYISKKDAANLSSNKDFLYSPLEAQSSFADDELVGGLGMVQLLRYSESPVGPYDELVIIPGNFKCPAVPTSKDRNAGARTSNNLRVTRIYVSQEKTCWNGRKNWNIPKHLARFNFEELPSGAISISVYTTGAQASSDGSPFFSAVYKPISYLPSFPASTKLSKYFGLDLSLVQPPLPEGDGASGELPGTKQWSKVLPLEWSSRTSLGWWDLRRKESSGREPSLSEGSGVESSTDGRASGIAGNWWPGIGRWRLGMKMEDATIEFPKGEHWLQGDVAQDQTLGPS